MCLAAAGGKECVVIMKKIIMYLFCMALFMGCTQQKTEKSQNEKQDFWQATLQAIENDLDGNTYDNGKWSIGVEDISMAMDPDHRSIVIRQIFTTDLQKNTMKLKDLYKVLPKTGRLQYNSINMKEYQPIIKSIIDDLINSDEKLSQQFHQYMKKLDMLQEVMEEQGGDISSIKEAELNKFYERVGNYILQIIKKANILIIRLMVKKSVHLQRKETIVPENICLK